MRNKTSPSLLSLLLILTTSGTWRTTLGFVPTGTPSTQRTTNPRRVPYIIQLQQPPIINDRSPFQAITTHLYNSNKNNRNSNNNNDTVDSSFNPSRIFLDTASALLPPRLAQRVEAFTGNFEGFLDRVTDGWALSFADLTPETPRTALGQAFLWTNLAYLVAGITLTVVYNDFWLAFWTDCAAICSYNYHYTQLQCCAVSSNNNDEEQRAAAIEEVRLALLVDYTAAGISILSALFYLISATFVSHTLSPEEGQAVLVAMVGTSCLLLSWKWEYSYPYMFWHGLWHLFSAYSGYLVGVSHQHVMEGIIR